MGRAGWGIADSGYRKQSDRGEAMPLARRARRLRRPEMTHRAPRNRVHDRPPQNFERLWFLKGCEKTIVHIADRQIWIDQACKAKWLYVRNNPVRHRLVKHPEDLPFQGVMDNFD
jgi:hypothetical protein